MSAGLSEADNQYFLGLYRCAVSEYQPKIEKRTGVALGDIAVRDFREIDNDFMRDMERQRSSWLARLLWRSTIKSRLKQWREHLSSTHAERASACMACYVRDTIYVSFTPGLWNHEFGIAFAVVHELSHALWERLAGEPLTRRTAVASDCEKFELFVEGFATYAEFIWFLDAYPRSVQRTVEQALPTPGSVHYRGMKRIEQIVQQNGQHVLLEIPKRWREL
ncbi:MAG TPA: hypothetical protein VF175_14645 [Lacipirellula sp.]